MDIGFVTTYSKETVEFAAKAGFDCLEVFVGKDSGLPIGKIDIDGMMAVFAGNNVKVGTIACAPNHLTGDLAKRKEINREFIDFIKVCKRFGTDIIMTNAWADRSKSPVENIAVYREVFSEYAKAAEYEGVRIALENCPHYSTLPYPMEIGNICYCPDMWDALFEAVPSDSIGLEFDPSHLFWLGIDPYKAIRAYGSKIFAFHAKDTEINEDERNKYGILGKLFNKDPEWEAGWWRYRMPGWGQIDWKEIFRALNDVSYKGPMIIEHEDPVFGGDRWNEGLMMGLRYLRQFMM